MSHLEPFSAHSSRNGRDLCRLLMVFHLISRKKFFVAFCCHAPILLPPPTTPPTLLVLQATPRGKWLTASVSDLFAIFAHLAKKKTKTEKQK